MNAFIQDDHRGYSENQNVSSIFSQTYAVDPTKRTISGGTPLTEALDNQSPYQFASNNPILINDPLGPYNDTLPGVVVVVPHKPAPKNALTNPPWEFPGTISPNTPSKPTPTTPIPTTTPSPEPVDIRIEGGGALLGPAAALTTVFTLIPQSTGDLDPNWLDRYRVFNPYPGHANRTENWDPHIVYQISFTPTDKFTPKHFTQKVFIFIVWISLALKFK